VAFSLFAYVGDPVAIMLGQDFTEEARQRLIRDLGLDQPFFIQYFNFLVKAAQGEFGISYRLARPVSDLLMERLPATLELSLCAALLALLFGVPMGVYTGLNRDSWLSRLMLTVSLIGVSLPTFLIGILLILVFSVLLGWLPSFGRGTTVALGWWTTGFLTPTGLRALILPSITLALFQLTLIMRLVRSEMLEVLRTDYIKFARARGIIAFAIVTETVFQWPGMGFLFIQSVSSADVPVMAAYLILIAFFFVLINLVVDLLYYAVDPRLRIDRGAAGGH
jgi:peptide/nickel transport system permease protein